MWSNVGWLLARVFSHLAGGWNLDACSAGQILLGGIPRYCWQFRANTKRICYRCATTRSALSNSAEDFFRNSDRISGSVVSCRACAKSFCSRPTWLSLGYQQFQVPAMPQSTWKIAAFVGEIAAPTTHSWSHCCRATLGRTEIFLPTISTTISSAATVAYASGIRLSSAVAF